MQFQIAQVKDKRNKMRKRKSYGRTNLSSWLSLSVKELSLFKGFMESLIEDTSDEFS